MNIGTRTLGSIATIRGRLLGLADRFGWGVADQGMSSLTNFAVGVTVARSVTPSQFGAFSIALATYFVALNASRGLASDPLLVRYSSRDLAKWRAGVGLGSGTTVVLGIGVGALCVAAGIIAGNPTRPALIGVGITMPGLLLQDFWRFAFFAQSRQKRAFVNDAVWAAALGVLFAIIIVSGRGSQFTFILAWGAAATVAAVAGAFQARLTPSVTRGYNWFRLHGDLSTKYLVENAVSVSGIQLKFFGLGAIAGLAAVGSLRAAELFYGPVFVFITGIGLVAVPQAVASLARSRQSLLTFCVRLSVAGAGFALLWTGIIAVFVTDGIGRQIAGASYGPASTLLIPVGLALAANAYETGAVAGLHALAAASTSLLARAVGSGVYLLGALIGASLGDAIGTAWGIALASAGSAVFAWWHFHRTVPR